MDNSLHRIQQFRPTEQSVMKADTSTPPPEESFSKYLPAIGEDEGRRRRQQEPPPRPPPPPKAPPPTSPPPVGALYPDGDEFSEGRPGSYLDKRA